MKSRLFISGFFLLPFAMLAGGCAATQSQLEQALRTDAPGAAAHTARLETLYHLRCPDILDVQVAGRPDLSGARPIRVDGRIRLDPRNEMRVTGHSAVEVGLAIAGHYRLPAQAVAVRVVEYKSQLLQVFSDVKGVPQVVPYRGPETVLDLLQRMGGVKPGSALGDISIVRSHIADGRPPEVFHVNLPAILLHHELQTNIQLEPFDRIYIGENRRSRLACCVPPALLPLYRRVCGIAEP